MTERAEPTIKRDAAAVRVYRGALRERIGRMRALIGPLDLACAEARAVTLDAVSALLDEASVHNVGIFTCARCGVQLLDVTGLEIDAHFADRHEI